MAVQLRQLPPTMQHTLIASADTNAIAVTPAVTGKIVCLWGIIVTGGTSIVISSNLTALMGALATSGLGIRPPGGNRADSAYPIAESAVGETIKITPGASGLNGIAYWAQV